MKIKFPVQSYDNINSIAITCTNVAWRDPPDDQSEWEDDGFDEEAYLGEEEESDPTIAPLSVADPRRGLLSIHAEVEMLDWLP